MRKPLRRGDHPYLHINALGRVSVNIGKTADPLARHESRVQVIREDGTSDWLRGVNLRWGNRVAFFFLRGDGPRHYTARTGES